MANVMGRFFLVIFAIVVGGMFFYTSDEKTVTQDEALTFQQFLAKQTEPTTTAAPPAPTRVPGFGAPHFLAEGDDKKEPRSLPEVPLMPTAGVPAASGDDLWDPSKWLFQEDIVEYPNPKFSGHTQKLQQYKPHNYKGKGHPTFATYLSTRGGTMDDPYFKAAQQLAYRILWDPRSKSKHHPFTVFVAPFIPEEQRAVLTAAGANVQELDLVPWHPAAQTNARWRDLFSKLNMWERTDFTHIAFLDVDAFPLKNIDALLDDHDLIPRQTCDESLLPAEDAAHLSSSGICDYIFSGTIVADDVDPPEINVGVMVFKPNKAMHKRLLRESRNTDKYDESMAEQAFLSYAFGRNGPFPFSNTEREWNGFLGKEDEEGKLNVLHEKLWSKELVRDAIPWASNYFNSTWNDMLFLYEHAKYEQLRQADGFRDS